LYNVTFGNPLEIKGIQTLIAWNPLVSLGARGFKPRTTTCKKANCFNPFRNK